MPDVQDVTPAEEVGAVVDEAPTSRGETNDGDVPLGEGGVKALRAERERAKRLESELRAFREAEQQRAEAEKSELQKAQERAERAEQAAQAAERRAFAASAGIPENLLTGATPEEWQASADALIAFRGAQQQRHAPAAEGVQGNTGQPVTTTAGQLSQADVQKMYAAKDYDGINKARAEGRLNTILGIN